MATVARDGFGPLAIPALASLGAGVIHLAVLAGEVDHRSVVVAFLVVAAAQLVWCAVALTAHRRSVAIIGVILGLAVVGVWIAATTRGIGWVTGFTEPRRIRLDDLIAATLAVVAALGAARVAVHPAAPRPVPRWSIGIAGVVIVVLVVPAVVVAASGQVGDAVPAAGEVSAHAGSHAAGPSVRPFDPARPLDLSGVPGVTPAQEAAAARLVERTGQRLPRFADPAVAVRAGFRSLGDASTGVEHLVNWAYLDDDHVLDPDHPEALVYERRPGKPRRLLAAMYMLTPGTTREDIPDVGGNLLRWHVDDTLCMDPDPVDPHLAGLAAADGTCPAPTVPVPPVPMVHVWITPHPCGPFAGIEDLGVGTVDRSAAACAHVHGSGP